MVDTPLSNSGAERREGSSPSPRTDPAQQIHDWNTSVFADAKRKREEAFDALLDRLRLQDTEPDLPTLF